MKCPKCGLINPDSAQKCDCGYNFQSRSMQEPYLTLKEQRRGGINLKHKFKLNELNSPEIEIDQSFWWGTIKVFVNGKKIERLREKGKPFPIPMSDGSIKKMFVKSGGFDYVPKIVVEGKEYLLARKLLWHEYVLVLLPFPLLLIGGAIGGAFAAIGIITNRRILRTDWSMAVKISSVFGVTLLSVIGYLIGAAIFRTLITPRTVNWFETSSTKYAFEQHEKAKLSQEGETASNKSALLTSRSWRFQGLLNQDGIDVTGASNPNIGSKKYFKADGNFSQVYRDGSLLTGKWKFYHDETLIVLSIDGTEYSAEVIELTENMLKILSDEMVVVHLSD